MISNRNSASGPVSDIDDKHQLPSFKILAALSFPTWTSCLQTTHYHRLPANSRDPYNSESVQNHPSAFGLTIRRKVVAVVIKSIFTNLMQRSSRRDYRPRLIHLWPSQRLSRVSSNLSLPSPRQTHRCSAKTDILVTAAVASGVKSSLAPIRAIQHRDSQGNPIGSYSSGVGQNIKRRKC